MTVSISCFLNFTGLYILKFSMIFFLFIYFVNGQRSFPKSFLVVVHEQKYFQKFFYIIVRKKSFFQLILGQC